MPGNERDKPKEDGRSKPEEHFPSRNASSGGGISGRIDRGCVLPSMSSSSHEASGRIVSISRSTKGHGSLLLRFEYASGGRNPQGSIGRGERTSAVEDPSRAALRPPLPAVVLVGSCFADDAWIHETTGTVRTCSSMRRGGASSRDAIQTRSSRRPSRLQARFPRAAASEASGSRSRMRFGERLLREAVPEWSGSYVDYERLKRAIDVKDAHLADGEFQVVVTDSLGRTGSFFREKMDQLQARFDALVETDQGEGTDATDLYLEGLELRRFAMVNALAVVKAVKKWNKNHPERQRKAMLLLQGQPFFNSSELTHLLAEVELQLISQCPPNDDLHEDLVCPICLDLLQSPVVFDCAHRFCWDCAVNHAINQVKAVCVTEFEDEHKISCHCPVCRKPQSLGLDELPIDEDLEEIIHKHFGRSAGLDSRSVPIPITIRERLKYSKSISDLSVVVNQTEAAEKQRQVLEEQWTKILSSMEASASPGYYQANLEKIMEHIKLHHPAKAVDVQEQVEVLVKKIQEDASVEHVGGIKRRWSPPPRHESMFGAKEPKGVAVVGHRGDGANRSSSMCNADVRENTLAAFERAASNGADFVELDVQLTKDGIPVIWHDDRLFFRQDGRIQKYRISEIEVSELKTLLSDVVLMRDFQANGHAREVSERLEDWLCGTDSAVPTLEDVLTNIPACIGLNLEIKFLEESPTTRAERDRMHHALINVLLEHAGERRIVLSSFDPDSAIELRAFQLPYPIFMLTERGEHPDPRRNSLAAALMVAIGAGLDGVACEVAQLLDEAREIGKYVAVAKRAGLKIVTFGSSTDPEALRKIVQLGVCAVITDHIRFTRESLGNALRSHLVA